MSGATFEVDELSQNAGKKACRILTLPIRPGVQKQPLHLYVARGEAMVNTKRVAPKLMRRMRIRNFSACSHYM
jgi:hypothetical protein